MATTGGVVVWEWQNEFGSWRPYDPRVSTFIESNRSNPYPLPLGQVDPTLYLYDIDLQKMCQTRQGTGTQRNIRRTVYPATSPLAKGITWQWEGDVSGRWNDYDAEITEYLETCFSKNATQTIDMSTSKFFQPYHIDLKNMTQKRIETGRVRKMQRVFTHGTYPLDSSNTSGAGGKRSSSAVSGSTSSALSGSTSNKRPRHGTTTFGSSSSSLFQPVPLPSASTASLNVVPGNPMSGSSLNVPGSVMPVSALTGSSSAVPVASFAGPSSALSASVLGGGQAGSHGPLTRRRYNQALTVMQQGQTPNMFQIGPSLHQTQQGTGQGPGPLSLGSGPSSGFNLYSSGLLGNVFQQVSGVAAGGLVGGQTGPFPHVAPPTGFGSSQYGHFVPQSLFPGSRSSKVRPSQQHGSLPGAGQLPQHAIIPNFTDKPSKRSANRTSTAISADSILDNFSTTLGAPPENEDCCICCERLVEASGHGAGSPDDQVVIQLEKCAHMFHKLCLRAMYDSGPKGGSLQCPTCKTIYGEKQGNCPRGEMEYRVIDTQLEGHDGCKTIQILYHIASGTQGPEHPHPGSRYSCRGFPRIGYLPDCDKGRKVLQLLIVAWKRRLTFTVGQSTTTGEANTVTWNEIHHKTELRGNYSGHGFPDPNFLDNVLLELATHGITERDLPDAQL